MIRYQIQHITIPAGNGQVTEQTIELYRDMASVTGITIQPVDETENQLGQIEVADSVKPLIDAVPLHYWKTPYMFWVPVHTAAAGANLYIKKYADSITRDVNLLLTLMLRDKTKEPAKPFRYFYKRVEVSQMLTGGIWQSNLINIPTEYTYISGIWVTIRARKGNSVATLMKPVPLTLALYDITGMIRLDSVPVDLLYRDGAGYNHNRRFYPVNIKAGQSIKLELHAIKTTPDVYMDVIFLLSNDKIKL